LTEEELRVEWDDLLFGVRRSVRYHTRRRMFFDRFDLITSALSVIFGSATVFTVLSIYQKIAIAVAASVTVLSSLDIVVGAPKAAGLHEGLARRFVALERSMILLDEADVKEKDLRRFTAERLEIEQDEPPKLRVLDCECHNELVIAMGYPKDHLAKIRFYQRWFAQFLDVHADAIRPG
jgi:hypothetical protein